MCNKNVLPPDLKRAQLRATGKAWEPRLVHVYVHNLCPQGFPVTHFGYAMEVQFSPPHTIN